MVFVRSTIGTKGRKVYVLQHVAREGTEEENVKFLGVYSSRDNAEKAVKRLRNVAGFKRYPKSFHIDGYPLNEIYWEEGFMTVHTVVKKTKKTSRATKRQ